MKVKAHSSLLQGLTLVLFISIFGLLSAGCGSNESSATKQEEQMYRDRNPAHIHPPGPGQGIPGGPPKGPPAGAAKGSDAAAKGSDAADSAKKSGQ
jgi:hypothetical protein